MFEDSSSARRIRRAWRQDDGLWAVRSEGSPLRVRVSGVEKVELQAAVVRVRRSAWERVTEREELVGRLRAVSRLPQYLCFGR